MTVEQAAEHMLNPPSARRPWKMDDKGNVILSNGMRMTEPKRSTHTTYTQRKFNKWRKK